MKFYKFISIIFHPIVVPTISVMLYFLVIPNNFDKDQKLVFLSFVFLVTYLVPLLILIVFKKFNLIKSYKTESAKERKLPIAVMIVLFYLIGNYLNKIYLFNDLGILFYAASLGLVIVYIFLFFKIKLSVHLLCTGLFIGFYMYLSHIYSQPFLLILIIGILISGLVASSRLHLKKHTHPEIYSGFFIGILCPLLVYFLL